MAFWNLSLTTARKWSQCVYPRRLRPFSPPAVSPSKVECFLPTPCFWGVHRVPFTRDKSHVLICNLHEHAPKDIFPELLFTVFCDLICYSNGLILYTADLLLTWFSETVSSEFYANVICPQNIYILGSPRAFRDEYLVFVYGKEGVGAARDKNNMFSKTKQNKNPASNCPKPFRIIGLFRLWIFGWAIHLWQFKKLTHFWSDFSHFPLS